MDHAMRIATEYAQASAGAMQGAATRPGSIMGGEAPWIGDRPAKVNAAPSTKGPSAMDGIVMRLETEASVVNRIAREVDELADRLFGPVPENATSGKDRPYAAGVTGTVAIMLDELTAARNRLEHALGRLVGLA